MINTYINDNANVPYPFFGMGKLPFPMSCIVGMGVCILSDVANPVYASSIEITADTIKAVLVYGNTIIGTVECTTYAGGRNGVLKASQSDIAISGFMTIGDIPASAIGSYEGTFYIDPSCVTFISEDVNGYHTDVVINGVSYALGQQLEFVAAGLLTMNGKIIAGTQAAADSRLTTYDLITDYSMVKTINGMSFQKHTETHTPTLTLRTDYPDYIKFDVIGGASYAPEDEPDVGESTVVVITGTRKFPNCYKADDDQADER